MSEKKKVVVVGGGFAGLNFIKGLNPNQFDILLIDKLNHHQFQPLLYQVATSQLEPSSISFPLRHVFRKMNHVRIRLAEVLSVDLKAKKLITSVGDFDYDELVLAMGCKTNFFGNKEIEKHALTLKSTYDAIAIRNHILQNFEDILSAENREKEALLHICIVGGGPTGVELAGAFAEIKKHVLPRDFHRIDFSKLRILLIEGSPYPLNNMSNLAKVSTRDYLEKMGVEILLNSFVKSYDGEVLMLQNGEKIKTKTVIWAAGVTPNRLGGLPEHAVMPNGRLKVDRCNQLVGVDEVYALGDLAYMETDAYPKGHPQVANVAINQGKNLATNMNKGVERKNWKKYEYKDLGSMATIGRNKAVVDLPFVKFKGYPAWLVWMFLHLMLILSVRNKVIIFINWAWAYINKDTALRLILKSNK